MLSLFVRVDGVDIGVPCQDRLVVGVDEGRDVPAGVALAQRGNERRGADQIADVVAAYHQQPRRALPERCRRSRMLAHHETAALFVPRMPKVCAKARTRSAKASSEKCARCTLASSASKRNPPLRINSRAR